MAEVKIRPRNNGPYVITGDITLVDADGKPFETEGTIALCRCGQSANKPFCDGAHAKVGFESTVKAP